MPLMTPHKCWRGRDDCVSLASVEAPPADATEDQIMDLDYEPVSFVCCGCVDAAERVVPQDAYRLCFKNPDTDEMTDNDDQDLSHLGYVISQAMAIVATRRVNQGEIDVLTDDGMARVATKQLPPSKC